MDGYSGRNREIDSERETKKKMTVSLTEIVKINDTDDGIYSSEIDKEVTVAETVTSTCRSSNKKEIESTTL